MNNFKEFEMQEIEEFLQNDDIQRQYTVTFAGKGAFGAVAKVVEDDGDNQTTFAVKNSKEFNFDSNECDLVRRLFKEKDGKDEQGLNNLIRIIDQPIKYKHNIFIKMEYCEFDFFTLFYRLGSVAGTDCCYLNTTNLSQLNENELKHMLYGALNGLLCLHSNGYVHNDIKAKNLLISANGTVKICDYGCIEESILNSNDNDNDNSNNKQENKDDGFQICMGTIYIFPLEKLCGCINSNKNGKADIWGLGCVFTELLTGQSIHQNYRFDVAQKMQYDPTYTPPEEDEDEDDDEDGDQDENVNDDDYKDKQKVQGVQGEQGWQGWHTPCEQYHDKPQNCHEKISSVDVTRNLNNDEDTQNRQQLQAQYLLTLQQQFQQYKQAQQQQTSMMGEQIVGVSVSLNATPNCIGTCTATADKSKEKEKEKEKKKESTKEQKKAQEKEKPKEKGKETQKECVKNKNTNINDKEDEKNGSDTIDSNHSEQIITKPSFTPKITGSKRTPSVINTSQVQQIIPTPKRRKIEKNIGQRQEYQHGSLRSNLDSSGSTGNMEMQTMDGFEYNITRNFGGDGDGDDGDDEHDGDDENDECNDRYNTENNDDDDGDDDLDSDDHDGDENVNSDRGDMEEDIDCISNCPSYIHFRNLMCLFGLYNKVSKQLRMDTLCRLLDIEKMENDENEKCKDTSVECWKTDAYIQNRFGLKIDQQSCVKFLKDNICTINSYDNEKEYFQQFKQCETTRMVLHHLLAINVTDRYCAGDAMRDNIFQNNNFQLDEKTRHDFVEKLRKFMRISRGTN